MGTGKSDGADAGANAEFAEALRAAIDTRGLSLDRIRHHLRVRGHHISAASLSYWQSGRSRPDRSSSLAALGSLEEILGVPRGSLAAKLPKARRRHTVGIPHPPRNQGLTALLESGNRADELVAELGLAWGDGLLRISSQDVLTIDEAGLTTSHLIRELFVATRHGVDRFPSLLHYDDPDLPGYYVGVTNCTEGRSVIDERHRLTVTELLLDRPLHEGEAALVETAIDVQDTMETEWLRAFTTFTRDCLIEVRFDEGALPTAAWSIEEVDGVTRETPLRVDGPVLTQVYSDLAPGVVGIRWKWSS